MSRSYFAHCSGWVAVVWMLCPVSVRAAEPLRVLVIANSGVAAIPPVVSALRSPSADASGRRRAPVGVEVKTLARGQDPTAFARELRPTFKFYTAIYAASMVLARAVQQVEPGLPIVFKGEADPVSMCLVDSMQRPGRNATGYVDYLPDDERKMLDTLVQGYPRLRIVYIMVDWQNFFVPDCGPLARNPKPARLACVPGLRSPGSDVEWMQETGPSIEQASRLGLQVKFMVMCQRSDFARLAQLESGRNDVGFVFPLQTLFWAHADEIVAQISRTRRPAIYGRSMFAEIGGLMAVEPILDAADDSTAIDMLWQVLEGRSPADMPVQVPRGYRLVLNAAVAAAHGLKPSMQILRRADEILTGIRH